MPCDPSSVSTPGLASVAGWQTLPPAFAPAALPRRLSLPWLAARVATISMDELRARAWGSLRRALASLPPRSISAPASADIVAWIPGPRALDRAAQRRVEDDAAAILAGRHPLLGRWIDAGPLPHWTAPFRSAQVSSETLLDPAEEVRYALELNRHGHFVTLAQAWLLTGASQPLQRIGQHLSDWLARCPTGSGPAWMAAIEPSMRLIQWAVVWQWTRRAGHLLGPGLVVRWLDAVDAHVRHVRLNLSSHSSANNHLIAELTALVVAAATWPSIAEPARIGLPALGKLESELLAQHAGDGVNREQAIAYQIFVFDLYLLARMAAPQLDRTIRGEVDRRMADSARFVAALRDRSGNLPAWGDSDLRQSLPRRFAEGGYYLLGCDFGGLREVLACIDCGALGYLRIAAHGHADALALTLSVGGFPVLVDRGTYSYNALPASRRRMRGTLQHNTVTVDGLDQSEPAGPFLWTRHASATCTRFTSTDAEGEFVGQNDGYRALPDPVRHERRIVWQREFNRLCVIDHIDGRGEHDIAVAWHFAPTCHVERRASQLAVTTSTVRLRVRATTCPAAGAVASHFNWLFFHGDGASLLGWQATSFGQMEAAPTLLFGGRCSGGIEIATTFDILWPEDSQ